MDLVMLRLAINSRQQRDYWLKDKHPHDYLILRINSPTFSSAIYDIRGYYKIGLAIIIQTVPSFEL